MGSTYMKFVNDSSHNIQDFCLSGIRDITVIVQKDSLKKWRNHVCIDHFQIISLLYVGINELQYFLFDSPESANFGSFGSNSPCARSVKEEQQPPTCMVG